MCDENENNNNCCLADLLRKILKLQKKDNKCKMEVGCDKPFLGPTIPCVCYNTRPVSFYNCSTGDLWNINYTINGTTATSDTFRVEDVDDCCCTCRILIREGTGNNLSFIPTNQFFTIDLGCVSAVQCYPDTYLDIC